MSKSTHDNVIEPKGRFRSLRICMRQRSRGVYYFVKFLNIHPIGDRCKAKSSFRKRFFGSFSSLKIEHIMNSQTNKKKINKTE